MNTPFVFKSPTDKMPGAWHGAYLGVYRILFERLRKIEGSILEIGTDGGGSLLMYDDYFSANKAHRPIIGCDISSRPDGLNCSIFHHQMDAYSPPSVINLSAYAPYALMVDDGCHTIEAQRFFVANYPQMLAPEGLAIVEDVAKIEDVALLAEVVPPGFFSFAIDLRHHGRFDNVLFCIQRE